MPNFSNTRAILKRSNIGLGKGVILEVMYYYYYYYYYYYSLSEIVGRRLPNRNFRL